MRERESERARERESEREQYIGRYRGILADEGAIRYERVARITLEGGEIKWEEVREANLIHK